MKVEGMAVIEERVFWLGYRSGRTPLDQRPHPTFAFDNEKPAHQVFLQDFAIDKPLVATENIWSSYTTVVIQNLRSSVSEGWEDGRPVSSGVRPCTGSCMITSAMIQDFKGLDPVSRKA